MHEYIFLVDRQICGINTQSFEREKKMSIIEWKMPTGMKTNRGNKNRVELKIRERENVSMNNIFLVSCLVIKASNQSKTDWNVTGCAAKVPIWEGDYDYIGHKTNENILIDDSNNKNNKNSSLSLCFSIFFPSYCTPNLWFFFISILLLFFPILLVPRCVSHFFDVVFLLSFSVPLVNIQTISQCVVNILIIYLWCVCACSKWAVKKRVP